MFMVIIIPIFIVACMIDAMSIVIVISMTLGIVFFTAHNTVRVGLY